MIEAYKNFWKDSFSFRGRTERKTFWPAMFVHLILLAVLLNFYHFFTTLNTLYLPLFWQALGTFCIYLFGIYIVVSFLPYLAITVRRLRDADFPWALIFLNLVFLVGPLVLLGLNLVPSSSKRVNDESTENRNTVFNKKIEERNKISFSQALAHYFQGYFSFGGRSSRRSFWFVQFCWWGIFALLKMLVFLAPHFDWLLFGQVSIGTSLMKLFLILFLLGTILPQFALMTRRLRDAGLSEIGSLILLTTSTSLLLFQKILSRTLSQAYVGHRYDLVEYLLFLFLGVVLIALIIACLSKADELRTSEKSILFNKMD
ncbi:DUF805 domain-containing protein [Lactococcus kimchii]|uniref:DUF805 domain-containing protein n=1 Tax=Lactococcus sp. S-13 TaxID=2507158 RepID=UPI001022EF18|nr:DUF805 domain-containing protein [Lactococcus sp. S-13]RZI48495.1 DUF805 domain-containing protein [Lactococcus sp. S-13]